MKLSRSEIERIIAEVEQQKADITRRYMDNLDKEIQIECKHGDWGDRK